MNEGLEINLEAFKKLPRNEKDALIYQNILDIKRKGINYKFQNKINYVWLTCLTIALGLKKIIGF